MAKLQRDYSNPDFLDKLANHWHHRLTVILKKYASFFMSLRYQGANTRPQIVGFFADGEVQALSHDWNKVYQVSIQLDNIDPPYRCNCPRGQEGSLCLHVLGLRQAVLQGIGPAGEYGRLIRENRFTPERRRNSFTVDAGEKAMSQLSMLLINSQRVSPPPPADNLDRVAVDVENRRLAWRFRTEFDPRDKDGLVQIVYCEAMIQSARKNGTGYSKGRLARPADLQNLRDIQHTPIEATLVREALHASRFHTEVTFDPAVVAAAIADQDNIWVEGVESRICRTTFLVMLVSKDADNFHFVLTTEDGVRLPHGHIQKTANMLVAHPVTKCLLLGRYPCHAIPLLQNLLEIESIPNELLGEFVEKSKSLQSTCSILLPSPFAGSAAKAEPRPVMLLRSNADGTLTYGVRLRDYWGNLHLPGQIPAVISGLFEGKPVQLVRDLARELEITKDLTEEFNLSVTDAQQFAGTESDVDTSLRLLTKLNDLRDTVETLWDKSSLDQMQVIGRATTKNVRVEVENKRDWFGISGMCDLGDQQISLNDLLGILRNPKRDDLRGNYIRLKDNQWIEITTELRKRLQQIDDVVHTERKSLVIDATAAPTIRDLMKSDIQVNAAQKWLDCLTRLERAEQLDPQVPANLQATLRDYQVHGYKWLRRLAEWGVGAVLADDMGSAKHYKR